MKTIEERANEYIGHPFEVDEGTSITTARVSYIRGADEQRAIDDAELAEVRKQRDAYYDELLKLRVERLEWINKAVAWVDHNVGTLTAMTLRKVMEG